MTPPGRAPKLLRHRILPLMIFLAALAFLCRSRGSPPDAAMYPDTAIKVRMLYSGEKKAWLVDAATSFMETHPGINLELVGMDSFESAEAILSKEEEALVWSPGDSMTLDLLREKWRGRYGTAPFPSEGVDAPQSLLINPLVWLVWEDRAPLLGMLQENNRDAQVLSWDTAFKALTAPEGWKELGAKEPWGDFKLGYASPVRSAAGFQALRLMTLAYFGNPRVLTSEQLNDPNYRERLIQVQLLSSNAASNAWLLDDMLRFGPSRLDVVMTYESYAISALERVQTHRWGNLRVYYPPFTIWSDSPIVMLETTNWNAEEKKAARAWIDYLLGREQQKRAILYGMRPADPTIYLPAIPGPPNWAVQSTQLDSNAPANTQAESRDLDKTPDKTKSPSSQTNPRAKLADDGIPDELNPFKKFASNGIYRDIPAAVERPNPSEANVLMELWKLSQPSLSLDLDAGLPQDGGPLLDGGALPDGGLPPDQDGGLPR
ncbi:substrate-binding domain-containing protein [Hyalangium versicolor]|uniref:substrate-binding domain-containing protein n=1 Tax=Hyalangium versicolor TaxID=2861190 RepID=UPI001CCD1A49|nr:substrate-binding domain-containing protein [Hyalangium versicolor]